MLGNLSLRTKLLSGFLLVATVSGVIRLYWDLVSVRQDTEVKTLMVGSPPVINGFTTDVGPDGYLEGQPINYTIDATDPKSGTAEFKATAIRIDKLEAPVPA